LVLPATATFHTKRAGSVVTTQVTPMSLVFHSPPPCVAAYITLALAAVRSRTSPAPDESIVALPAVMMVTA
jgi:hypothetical protein